MSSMGRHKGLFGAIVAAIMAATAVALLTVGVARADTVLNYDANQTSNPVADNITRLNVNKLDKDAHDYVVGAHLCIIEKETGRIVTEWISDGSVHEIARNTGDKSSLDIDKVYILRELEAPEGYAKATDTEFIIHSEDFNTTGEILSGEDADFGMISGHGDVQAFVINLYDESTLVTEEEEVIQREREREEGTDITRSDSTTTERENSTNTVRHVSDQETITRTQTITENKNVTRYVEGEEVVTTASTDSRTTYTNSSTGSAKKATENLPYTADDTSYTNMAAMALAGGICLVVGLYLTRRRQV